MKRIKNLLYVFAGIALLICTPTVVTVGQEPVGPTKPVVVVNTPAQPVPVTGTITGVVTLGGTSDVNVVNRPTVDARQSGPWNVGISGTPTVQVTPRGSVLLFDSGVYTNTIRRSFGPINIAAYSKIRISVVNIDGSEIFLNVWTAPAGEAFDAQRNFRLEGGMQIDTYSSKVYEVAGSVLFIDVFVGVEENTLRVGVWGN